MTCHDDREDEVVRALVSMAGSLVTGDADVLELLTELTATCARLLDVGAAGLLLGDQRGVLHVMGASSERAADLEALQAQRAEGPCQDCYRDGRPVRVPDLERHLDRWPHFVPAARAAGFASVHAVPLRLRGSVLGALGLFGSSIGDLNDADLRLAQGLADVASIALVQDRAATDTAAVNDQLQTALTSRVVLEQARGMLSHGGGVDVAAAFTMLRQYARDHNLRLSELAGSLVDRSLTTDLVIAHHERRHARRP